ncbi:ABC-type glycerol-3-phosphate transport system substrate-binding protein [Paenibacillus phyllosphaerae]|uniref:ABC-type glycerol-3-phosphate transport system substrate-binding protein n=1 Tax=Paenibacillus phyllosphaerae TaxID=274593 RepID=A0A7W5FKQ0_9BACL|nr:hypothetical protein [Paenibacillus phyllosphaerae]MBB3108298.1 ABC-type glycerol-3-phosphate transport system substrate-binding protein [Paenibacillus phyllosphaerae]
MHNRYNRTSLAALALTLTLTLSACGSTNQADNNGANTAEAETTAAAGSNANTQAETDTSTNTATEPAKSDEPLVVYLNDFDEIIQPLFEQATGYKLELVTGNGAELASRIEAE